MWNKLILRLWLERLSFIGTHYCHDCYSQNTHSCSNTYCIITLWAHTRTHTHEHKATVCIVLRVVCIKMLLMPDYPKTLLECLRSLGKMLSIGQTNYFQPEEKPDFLSPKFTKRMSTLSIRTLQRRLNTSAAELSHISNFFKGRKTQIAHRRTELLILYRLKSRADVTCSMLTTCINQ